MSPCPDLELLFAELADGEGEALAHARECEACSAILEDHRQLEKDLFRLADPLPPPDFVHNVMEKVARSAGPAASRSELLAGGGILALALSLSAVTLALHAGSPAQLGVELASSAVALRELVVGMGSALDAVWATAAMPITVGVLLTLFVSMLALKRLSSSSLSEVKVSP